MSLSGGKTTKSEELLELVHVCKSWHESLHSTGMAFETWFEQLENATYWLSWDRLVA